MALSDKIRLGIFLSDLIWSREISNPEKRFWHLICQMHALQWHSAWYNFRSHFMSIVEHFSEKIDSALSKFKWGIWMWKRKLGVRQVWNWSTCGSQFCHSKQHVNMQRPISIISKNLKLWIFRGLSDGPVCKECGIEHGRPGSSLWLEKAESVGESKPSDRI